MINVIKRLECEHVCDFKVPGKVTVIRNEGTSHVETWNSVLGRVSDS